MKHFNIIAGCATDKGNHREKNQDRIISLSKGKEDSRITLSCICDGIGSLKMSEISSDMMTSGLCRWFEKLPDYFPDIMTGSDVADSLEGEIRFLNKVIYEHRIYRENAIGCTMSVLLTTGDDYYIFHAGDSRIYLVTDRMKQLTRDEVVAREKNGVIKEVLCNYIAKQQDIWMIKTSGKINSNDMFLIGSDGLFKLLTYDDIASSTSKISAKKVNRICENMIGTVRDRGETDNVSCAIVYAAPKKKVLWW